MKLYDRICRVTLTRTLETADERRFFAMAPGRVEVVSLRMEFEVKKTLGKSPNQAKLVITNLAARTRGEVEGPPEGLVASIAAGHDGVARHLFTGDVQLAFSERDGANWRTEMTIGDGARAFARANVNGSYRPGTPMLNVLKDVARKLGLELPATLAADPALRTQLVGGHAMSGPARDELTRLLAPFGYAWSIQDGRLQILRDEDTAGTERELSEDTGMTGSPTFERTKGGKKKAARTTMKASAILYPELTPGGILRVEARQVDGRFRIEEVAHKGDTHGDEWTTELEAKELS